MTDVLIIGGGICGSTVARELSRYELSITVLERVSMCRQAHQRPTAV